MHVDQLSKRKKQNSRYRRCNRRTQARYHPLQRVLAKSRHESKEIFSENYKILRKDRVNDVNGGGGFQAVINHMVIIHLTDMDTNCEIIWTQYAICLKSSRNIYYWDPTIDPKLGNSLEASAKEDVMH